MDISAFFLELSIINFGDIKLSVWSGLANSVEPGQTARTCLSSVGSSRIRVKNQVGPRSTEYAAMEEIWLKQLIDTVLAWSVS